MVLKYLSTSELNFSRSWENGLNKVKNLNSFVPWYDLIDFANFQWADGADQTYINDLKEGSF